MYPLIHWKDNVVTNKAQKKLIDEFGVEHIVEIYPLPGEIIQRGTLYSERNMNHMDGGILDAHLATLIILQAMEQGAFPRFYEAREKEIYPLFGLEWEEPKPPAPPEKDDNNCDCNCKCCDNEGVASIQDIMDIF